MAILDQSNCSATTGFTLETGGGSDGTVSASGGKIIATRTSGNGTSPLGFVRTSGQAGATGHTIYWKFSYSAIVSGWGNFVGGINDDASVTHSGVPSIYIDESGGQNIFITWRGSSTVNSAIQAVAGTDYYLKAVVNSDGTITFSVATAGFGGPYSALSSSLVAQSFDAKASTLHFVGCNLWSGSTHVDVDQFYYTDDGTGLPTNGVGSDGSCCTLLLLGDDQ